MLCGPNVSREVITLYLHRHSHIRSRVLPPHLFPFQGNNKWNLVSMEEAEFVYTVQHVFLALVHTSVFLATT